MAEHLNAGELKKANEIVRALRCSDAPDEPDGMGCANKKCRYRDVDGACDIVSMCQDAADLIDSLTAQLTASQRREQAAVCKEKTVNRGMSVSGEYDIECNLICPSCGAVVGDAEWQELNGPYCNQCGQHIEIGPQEAEKVVAAIKSAENLIGTMRNNKKAALWMKKYGRGGENG